MSSTPNNPQSLFPDLPREMPAVTKEGNFSQLWSLGFSSLFQALQKNFKNEGVVFPNLNATDIADIQSLYTPLIGNPLPMGFPDISGQTVFDTTNRVSKQFVITYDSSSPPNILAAQWNIIAYLILGNGNPNGAQAGQIGWFYYDLTGMALYICTTSGSTSGAAWTSI
jgi:hypothetical protein